MTHAAWRQHRGPSRQGSTDNYRGGPLPSLHGFCPCCRGLGPRGDAKAAGAKRPPAPLWATATDATGAVWDCAHSQRSWSNIISASTPEEGRPELAWIAGQGPTVRWESTAHTISLDVASRNGDLSSNPVPRSESPVMGLHQHTTPPIQQAPDLAGLW